MSMKIREIRFIQAQKPPVIARADVHFIDFVLKGFKVIQHPETHKEYVTPPSYKAPQGWRPLFKTERPEDWEEIQKEILREYDQHLLKQSANEIKEN